MKQKQTDLILRYLQEYGSITPLEALSEFSCMRLGARIWDLRRDGYEITKTMEAATNRFGDPVHYARYTLVQ